jgi:hypothetical protein
MEASTALGTEIAVEAQFVSPAQVIRYVTLGYAVNQIVIQLSSPRNNIALEIGHGSARL